MRISSILLNEIFNFFGHNSSSLWNHIHRSRSILHTKQFWDLVPQYGAWYHKMLKNETTYLVLKATLRSGYLKNVRSVLRKIYIAQVGYV